MLSPKRLLPTLNTSMLYTKLISLGLGAALLLAVVPTTASAALTDEQIDSVLELLQSFGVGGSEIENVESVLRGTAVAGSGSTKVKTQGIFTFKGTTPTGTYKMESHITLATFNIFAKYRDLDGDTFRVDSRFSNDENFTKIRVVGLMHDCPEIIKRGTVGTCTVKVRFVQPGSYYYTLKNPSIERPKALTYDPESEVMSIGEGVLTIPLF